MQIHTPVRYQSVPVKFGRPSSPQFSITASTEELKSKLSTLASQGSLLAGGITLVCNKPGTPQERMYATVINAADFRNAISLLKELGAVDGSDNAAAPGKPRYSGHLVYQGHELSVKTLPRII